jgi:GNAT superfamily N-acetyltransferase
MGFEISAKADNYFLKYEVGYCRFVKTADGRYKASALFVYPDYRRQGIAYGMYKYAIQQGYTIIPGDIQTDLGRLLWNKLARDIE